MAVLSDKHGKDEPMKDDDMPMTRLVKWLLPRIMLAAGLLTLATAAMEMMAK